jgi:rhodanese-related sulfurtransferase
MQDITVTELQEKMQSGSTDFLVIDVREPYEYEEFNIGARLIPLGDLASALDDLQEWEEKEIVVMCRSGARSAAAKQFMVQNGFKNVRNLIGGVMDWQQHIG